MIKSTLTMTLTSNMAPPRQNRCFVHLHLEIEQLVIEWRTTKLFPPKFQIQFTVDQCQVALDIIIKQFNVIKLNNCNLESTPIY